MYRHWGPRGLLVLFAILLASCGGGGGPSTPAPSGLSYAAPPAFVINQTIIPSCAERHRAGDEAAIS